MICLLLGLIAGTLASASPSMAAVRPTWVHLITVGWLTQLIFGVALWIFPRPRSEQRKTSDALGWFGFWALNVGLLLRVAGEPMRAFTGRGGTILAVSALLQLCAVTSLVFVLWPRVREK